MRLRGGVIWGAAAVLGAVCAGGCMGGSAAAAVEPVASEEATGLTAAGCASGANTQVFGHGVVGCAGSVTWANRGTLCAAGWRPVTAAQWEGARAGQAPTSDYCTADWLKYSGASGYGSL